MTLSGWYHHSARLPDSKEKALWMGKVGKINHAVLTIDRKVLPAPASFKTVAVCKKAPVQQEIPATQYGCVTTGESFQCKSQGSGATSELQQSLKALDGSPRPRPEW